MPQEIYTHESHSVAKVQGNRGPYPVLVGTENGKTTSANGLTLYKVAKPASAVKPTNHTAKYLTQ